MENDLDTQIKKLFNLAIDYQEDQQENEKNQIEKNKGKKNYIKKDEKNEITFQEIPDDSKIYVENLQDNVKRYGFQFPYPLANQYIKFANEDVILNF